MISTTLRALSASAAVCCFYGGVAGLVISPNALAIAAVFVAALLAVPAMFGGRKPSSVDLPRIEQELQRFRGAMLLCFAGTAGVYATVITGRGRVEWRTLQQLSSLGVSLWLVAFVLMFFVAYYSTQRRLATTALKKN